MATHTVLGRWKTLLELDQVVGGELGEQLLDGRVFLFLSLAAEPAARGLLDHYRQWLITVGDGGGECGEEADGGGGSRG